MTRLPFDPGKGLILVTALLSGPSGSSRVRLALDTVATMTIVRTGILVSLGYDTAAADERVRITTASGVEYAPRIVAGQIEALGLRRENFPILAHTLPPTTTVDGLLGLDFLRESVLKIDLIEGYVELS